MYMAGMLVLKEQTKSWVKLEIGRLETLTPRISELSFRRCKRKLLKNYDSIAELLFRNAFTVTDFEVTVTVKMHFDYYLWNDFIHGIIHSCLRSNNYFNWVL